MGLKNVLFVVEGKKSEPKLIKELFYAYEIGLSRTIYQYETNVHALLQEIDSQGYSLEELDLLGFLREREANEMRKEKLNSKFTDIILVFDYDPQDPSFDGTLLERMLLLCNNSTSDVGKLYINYPMVESFEDVLNPPDEGYLVRTSPAQLGRGYKKVVAERSIWRKLVLRDSGVSKGSAFSWIIELNLMKVLSLLGLSSDEMTFRRACDIVLEKERDLEFLKLQNATVEKRGMVYICCSLLFFVCENWPDSVEDAASLPSPCSWAVGREA